MLFATGGQSVVPAGFYVVSYHGSIPIADSGVFLLWLARKTLPTRWVGNSGATAANNDSSKARPLAGGRWAGYSRCSRLRTRSRPPLGGQEACRAHFGRDRGGVGPQ